MAILVGGSVIVEDKTAPTIDCQDAVISCTQDLNTVPAPTATDNCDPSPTVQLIDEIIDDQMCANDTVFVIRTWVAFDNNGMASEPCNQMIAITRPASVDFPEDIAWYCEQYSNFPNITNPTAFTSFYWQLVSHQILIWGVL